MKLTKSIIIGGMAVLLSSAAFSDSANPYNKEELVTAPSSISAPEIQMAYGPNTVWTSIYASEFKERDGVPLDGVGSGYVYPTADYAHYFAQLHLPNGASIEWIYMRLHDTDSTGYVRFWLTGYEAGTNTDAPYYTDALGLDSGYSETPGYTTVGSAPTTPVILHEWDDLDGDGTSNTSAWVINVRVNGTAGNLGFWGAAVMWKRNIRPAPATATFSDVPTDYWAFASIEALNASGITAGCGGTNFCPDDNVTRAQMATFLARALGLHWGT